MDEEVKRIGGKTEELKQEESQCIWETIFICFVGSEINVLLSDRKCGRCFLERRG